MLRSTLSLVSPPDVTLGAAIFVFQQVWPGVAVAPHYEADEEVERHQTQTNKLEYCSIK